VQEQHQQVWAGATIGLLLEIKAEVERTRPSADCLNQEQLRSFEARYQILLNEGYAENPLAPAPAEIKRGRRKKTKPRNLLERLDHHRGEALAFMYDFNVPFDNNRAERDIRMMKVQQKIAEREKAARDSQSKADAIDAAVFDLKAVNPSAIVKIDTRSPDEVIRSIEEQGKIVAKSLATLKSLLES